MADQPAPAIPSGDQWSIGHGRDLAVISQVGATLRSYIHAGRPVVDGFGVDEWSHGGRGQVLAPWPNRLGDGRYVFQDLPIQVPLNEPERGNAIHGLVRWQLWQLETSHQNTVTASCRVLPTPGYPFALRLSIEYRLGRQGLTVATSVVNVGQSAAPFGIGFHPYLTVGAESIDTTVLSLPAEQRLVTDDRGLPTGDVRTVANTEFDFRTPRPIGPTRLDTSYTDLIRDNDGIARVRLSDPNEERRVELWADDRFRHLMCFTGDTLPDGQRRRAVAIEPMSCPPDAFRSGTDVVVLEPGGGWQGTWGLSPV